MPKPTFAVLLSGCGVFDGSEIQEAVLTLLAIDRAGGNYQCFAPNIAQRNVVNHMTGHPAQETRNVLVESARIARGAIRALTTYDPIAFDALILPGGFGAAKNLSSFALDGANCSIDPETEQAVKATFAAKKPVGAWCISPTILAKVLGKGKLTIGDDPGTAEKIEEMGATHVITRHGAVVVDVQMRIVTTPCYMLESRIGEVADGIEAAIREVFSLVRP